MRLPRILYVCAVVVPWAAGLPASGADAGKPTTAIALFERHLEAVGGRPALATIESVLVKGALKEGDQVAVFEFRAKTSGAFVLTVQGIGRKLERYGRDPQGRGWCEIDGRPGDLSPAAAGGRPLLVMAYLPHARFAWLPLLAKASCREIKQGRDVLMAVSGPAGRGVPPMTFLAETGRLRRIQRTEFRDYRLTEGVFVPFLIKEGATTQYVAQVVQFVQPMGDELFARPAPPADSGQSRGPPASPPGAGQSTEIATAGGSAGVESTGRR